MDMHPSTTALRWMWVWITIAVLVVLVVIGFLFGIASALESIDAGLEEADQALVGANGDVTPLPTHIQNVNASLERVDTALEPIPGQASTIRGELGSIRSTLGDTERSLTSTDGSLVDTEGSLDSTEGSLVDTEGSLTDTEGSLDDTARSLGDTSTTLDRAETNLVSVRSMADRIDRRLELAQTFRSLGTNGIWRRVRFLNGGRFFDASSDVADQTAPPANRTSRINREGLRFVERNADPIRAQLVDVNRDLTSICEQLRPLDLPSFFELQPGDVLPPRDTEGASEEC